MDLRRIIAAVVVISLFLFIIQAAPYKKVIHNTDPKAKCLDGSSPAVYLHQGQEKNKFLIYFQGGGYCEGTTLSEVLDSCYQRSKTNLGGSKDLPQTIEGEGYFSTDPSVSKFASWTKVLIAYCDGSLHQGSTDAPYRFKDASLYFRGADNVRSHFKWLQNNFNFSQASKVLLTGASAGGTATFLWSPTVKEMLKDPTALYSVVDSGVFMNAPTPQTGRFKFAEQVQALTKIANVNEKTPLTRCNRAQHAGEQFNCFFIQNAFTSIDNKMLLINSQYDSWALEHIIDIKCLTDGKQGKSLAKCSSSELSNIETYRKLYLNFISFFIQMTRNGVWSISCSQHVYASYNTFYNSQIQKVPESTGETVQTAIQRFVLDNQRVDSRDQAAWPSNSACAY